LISLNRRPSRHSDTHVTTPANASNSKEAVYETPTHRYFPELEEDDDDDDDNDFVEEDLQMFGRENEDPIASPYIVSYL